MYSIYLSLFLHNYTITLNNIYLHFKYIKIKHQGVPKFGQHKIRNHPPPLPQYNDYYVQTSEASCKSKEYPDLNSKEMFWKAFW